MHLNPIHPNILHDMQAAANGRDLRNQRYGIAYAKRHLIPRKSYPYASERQVKRQQLSSQYHFQLHYNASFYNRVNGDYATQCLTARIAAEIQAET